VDRSRVDGFLRQLAEDLQAADLRVVLNEVFGFTRYEGERTIDYFSPAGHALSLQYRAATRDRDPFGGVAELRRGPDLTDEDVSKLRDLYEMVRGPEIVYFNSLFLFSHRRVTGYWRYSDQFQICRPQRARRCHARSLPTGRSCSNSAIAHLTKTASS
jgi:hypothetical protein